MSELTLYADASWMSLWVFHAMVALEEKQLSYELETIRLPVPPERKLELQHRGTTGRVPILVHRIPPSTTGGDGKELWLSESSAISEYLAERFPTPKHPRIFPADLADRAKARQVMSMLRTSIMTIRKERPTEALFGRPISTPLSEKARGEAEELFRIVQGIMKPGGPSLFGAWCIADADLSLALMRMVASQDPMPKELVDYALRQWDRPSVKKYLSFLPTMH